jgi:hypothetical protein
MTPLHFEQLIMLRANRNHWNLSVVHDALTAAPTLAVVPDDNGDDEDEDDEAVAACTAAY